MDKEIICPICEEQLFIDDVIDTCPKCGSNIEEFIIEEEILDSILEEDK